MEVSVFKVLFIWVVCSYYYVWFWEVSKGEKIFGFRLEFETLRLKWVFGRVKVTVSREESYEVICGFVLIIVDF